MRSDYKIFSCTSLYSDIAKKEIFLLVSVQYAPFIDLTSHLIILLVYFPIL